MPSAEARRKRSASKKAQLRAGVSVNDVAASFQAALVETLVEKTARAAQAYDVTEVMMAGGVSANQALRQALRHETNLPVRYPPLNLCTDNGAMIAAAGFFRYQSGQRDDWTLEVLPMWPLTDDTYATET